MKNLKYLFLFILWSMVMPSCVEDTAPEDAYGAGSNLVSFTNASANLTAVATGEEFVLTVPMKVKGPSLEGISSPVTATISVDPASTAVEGVHYRLDETTIEFSPDNNLLNNFPITVLTDGIDPPLAQAPVLVLKVSDASGNNVIPNGKKLSINLLYLCDSQLQGTYEVTITRNDSPTPVTYTDVIAKTGPGQYRGTSVGHYAPGSLGGNPGFNFVDVCNVITVPEQNLVDLYSNLVYGIGASSVDPVTGNLHIEYEITFAAGNRQYVAEYVKQ